MELLRIDQLFLQFLRQLALIISILGAGPDAHRLGELLPTRQIDGESHAHRGRGTRGLRNRLHIVPKYLPGQVEYLLPNLWIGFAGTRQLPEGFVDLSLA